ncbi:MAG: hypothetical protein ACOCZV_01075 [Nanoarchaeota archaeon]
MPSRNETDGGMIVSMNKAYALALVITVLFLVSAPAQAVECVRGIDGYCNMECVEVDFDCASNPNHEGNTGIESTNSTEEDVNFEPDESGSQENRSDVPRQETDNPFEKPISEGSDIVLIAGFVAGLLMMIAFLLVLRRYEIRKGHTRKESTSIKEYIQRVRSQGFADSRIQQALLERGYSEKIVREAFQALDGQE